MPEVAHDPMHDAATPGLLICATGAVLEGGDGVRFPVRLPHGAATGFVVRNDGRVRGYLNQCSHVPVELDWEHGKFFDFSGLYLVCATHGAMYEADSGRCAGGPCRGGLRAIAIVEQDGLIYWRPDDYIRAPQA